MASNQQQPSKPKYLSSLVIQSRNAAQQPALHRRVSELRTVPSNFSDSGTSYVVHDSSRGSTEKPESSSRTPKSDIGPNEIKKWIKVGSYGNPTSVPGPNSLLGRRLDEELKERSDAGLGPCEMFKVGNFT
jgi:hypothetical protein